MGPRKATATPFPDPGSPQPPLTPQAPTPASVGLRLPEGLVSRGLCLALRLVPQGLPLDELLHRRQLTLGSTCLLAAVGQTGSGSQALRWSSACTRLSFLLITLLRSLSWLLPTPNPCVGWHRQPSNPPGQRRECCGGREQPRDRAQRMCVGERGVSWGL